MYMHEEGCGMYMDEGVRMIQGERGGRGCATRERDKRYVPTAMSMVHEREKGSRRSGRVFG